MALKKKDEDLTAAELEQKRVDDAKATDEQKEKDAEAQRIAQEEADKVEQKRLDDIAKENAEKERIAGEEAKAIEDKRLADKALEDQKQADSDAERLAQEAEVARAAGREPEELKLVKVESKIHSDLRQPSTGTWIPGMGEAHLLDDGWLENQINSQLLRKVKKSK